MKTIVVLIFFTSSQFACAFFQCEGHTSFRSGFLDLSEVASKSTIITKAMKNTLLLEEVGGVSNSKCSSAIVSKEGHILTASHCLDSCRHSWTKIKAEEKNYIKLESRSKMTCQIVIQGRIHQANILAMNPCKMSRLRDAIYNNEELKNKELSECINSNDIALIQVDPTYLPKNSCFGISNEKIHAGQNVASVGYPGVSDRKDPKIGSSDGSQVYGSVGKIVNQNHCQLNGDPILEKKIDEKALKWLNSFNGNMIQTTTDGLEGNSGGPLIDENGKIIGVMSSLASQFQDRNLFCAGSTFFSSVQILDKSLKNWNSNFKMEDLSCD